MSALPPRQFLTELISSEEGQERIKAIWDDVSTMGKRQIDVVYCPRCKEMKRLGIEANAYDLKAVTSFLNWVSSFGVGRPADDSKKSAAAADLEQQLDAGRQIDDLTNDELELLIEAMDGPDYPEILEAAKLIYEQKGKPLPKSKAGEIWRYSGATGKSERVDNPEETAHINATKRGPRLMPGMVGYEPWFPEEDNK